jgi:hypothetical protein
MTRGLIVFMGASAWSDSAAHEGSGMIGVTVFRFLTAAVILAAVLVSADCGGSGSSPPPTTPSPPPTTPPSTTPTPPAPPVVNPCSVLSGFFNAPQGIVNGVVCTDEQADRSSVVWLQMQDGDGRSLGYCSGTIIDTKAVLTAAHCVDGTTKAVAAFMGAGRQPITTREFYVSPDYTGIGPSSLDVGVVIFASSLERTPVPLFTSRALTGGESAVVAGWGTDGVSASGRTLRSGNLTVTRVTLTQIEAAFSETTSGVCYGDSGGPLLASSGGSWAVAGITSKVTSGCLSGASIWANVFNSSIKSFILKYVPGAGQR